MTPTLPIISSASSYHNKLQELAFTKPLYGSLIVDKNTGDLTHTHILRALWESAKGAFGHKNWTNKSLVELKIIELAAAGRQFSLTSQDRLWITMLAMRTLGNNFAESNHEELTTLVGRKVAVAPQPDLDTTALITHFIERSENELKPYNIQLPKIGQVFERAIVPSTAPVIESKPENTTQNEVQDLVVWNTNREIVPVSTQEPHKQPSNTWLTVRNIALLTFGIAAASTAIYHLWHNPETPSVVSGGEFCLPTEKPLVNITNLFCNARYSPIKMASIPTLLNTEPVRDSIESLTSEVVTTDDSDKPHVAYTPGTISIEQIIVVAGVIKYLFSMFVPPSNSVNHSEKQRPLKERLEEARNEIHNVGIPLDGTPNTQQKNVDGAYNTLKALESSLARVDEIDIDPYKSKVVTKLVEDAEKFITSRKNKSTRNK